MHPRCRPFRPLLGTSIILAALIASSAAAAPLATTRAGKGERHIVQTLREAAASCLAGKPMHGFVAVRAAGLIKLYRVGQGQTPAGIIHAAVTPSPFDRYVTRQESEQPGAAPEIRLRP